ncbi:MAG: TetR/AcrR family transcriptional regulator [Wenzhouxiangellaceae bacterium]|nr:TetR/AcrR family transcriptional regulator [Wenzhouxiangellaceae bacterium]
MRPKTFDQSQALEAAMFQFWEAGYEGSSMQNLVDRMGISRQSLYDTFGNKRELFESALKRYREDVVESRLAIITDPALRPSEAIRNHLEVIASGVCDMPVGCLMVRTATEISTDDSEIGALLEECVHEVKRALVGVIERGQSLGEFDRSRSADELACSVIATGMGLHVLRRLPNTGKSLRPSIDGLLAGLGVKPSDQVRADH